TSSRRLVACVILRRRYPLPACLDSNDHARIRLAGMQRVWLPQLPHRKGDAGRRPSRAEEVLPQGAETHAAQGVPEEVGVRGQGLGFSGLESVLRRDPWQLRSVAK